MRRAGRFEREISIGVPNEEERIEIMTKLTKGMRLRPDFPFKELVSATPGYVGADLQTLCKEASIIAVERAIRSTEVKPEKTDKEGGEAEAEVVENDASKKDNDDDDSDANELDLASFYIEVSDF